MPGVFGLDREELTDSIANVVPMAIIVLLTLLFVAYNPWGWREPLVIAIVFGLHLVPILALAPVTYLLVKLVNEAEDGRSDTAGRVKSLFEAEDSTPSDAGALEPTGDEPADGDA